LRLKGKHHHAYLCDRGAGIYRFGAGSRVDSGRSLAQLGVSDEITPETRTMAHKLMGIAELLERGRVHGTMNKAPRAFVATLMNSVAEATMDFMTQDSAHAMRHGNECFDAMWCTIA
jgi:hypothetical protein